MFTNVPPRRPRRGPGTRWVTPAAAVAVAVLGLAVPSASAADAVISQGKPATVSSVETSGTPAAAAVDGNAGTRWSSQFGDPQWIQIDLGGAATVSQVVLRWEAAYATAYQIQLSDNGSNWSTVYQTTTGTGGTQTLDVSGSGRYVRLYATARATPYGVSLWEFQVSGTGGGTTPPGAGIPPDSFWGDTSTIPAARNVLTVKVLNRTNGRYPDSQVYWNFGGQTHSIAEQPYLDMPANSAGRMYFSLGTPNSQYTDFIEFTVGPDVFNGNTTRVDAFALKLAMRLHAHDGYDVQVGDGYPTFQEDRSATFAKFQAEVPTEFKDLATVDAPYRIPAPGSAPDFRAGGRYANYFTSYAQSVGVDEPTSNITGCAGSLAGNPDMCAALNRHTAHLPQSQWQDPSRYYQAAPANHYAKFWHDHGINHLAYGFPYDDVAAQSTFVSHGDPQWLVVAVGW
ncbi:beta-1,3-glucanase family protein [Amycolatopsis sp. lyj-346]|uniref:beta-1,3-glucanase family protein n=1 Tax=Amycolatopsis sp. lyj-346 TaxID=2789289 RepID=UPI0039799EB0